MRYIDAFHGQLVGQRSTREFLAEVLGFKLTVPPIVEKVCTDLRQLTPLLQLTLPVAPGQLQIAISDGQVMNEPAVLVDTSVIISRPISIDPSTAVLELTEARNIIHEIFMQIAQPLHEYMQPVEAVV